MLGRVTALSCLQEISIIVVVSLEKNWRKPPNLAANPKFWWRTELELAVPATTGQPEGCPNPARHKLEDCRRGRRTANSGAL